ncbi:MAG: bifunctional oligoribonuclease/PAP phosphatase NrnA [Candidatus Gracilibacteria bacterium]|nr:bifunctional oligoribonuclease/PAP phosphatase NrnA [Candidatus Gracilibacteria bacterium]
MEQKIHDFGKKLALAKKILLINHIRMDPDCFGSLAALYLILEKKGYTVHAVNDDPAPNDFSFLGMNNIIKTDLDIQTYNPDLIISLDAASLSQLGNIYQDNQELFKTTDFVVFDHHITNPGFGSLNIINTNASSTCEVLFHTLEILGLDNVIDPKIATLLTAGIHTDTNIFYNANTTPETLITAAKLMKYGADFRAPMYEFYKKKTFQRTKLWGEVLKDIQQAENGKITYALIDEALFTKTGTNNSDTTGITNEFLANMEGSEVCFLLYPTGENTIKGSLRSKSIDVSAICASLGGGGHKLAAGFNFTGDIQEIEKILLGKLKESLK